MRLLALLLAVCAPVAFAWPVDWTHEVEVGREKFVKLPQVDWLEVEDASVVDVVWQRDSEELVLVGLKKGRTTVMLGAEGKVAAWRVRVGEPPLRDEAALKAAQKACPDLRQTPLDEVKLAVTAHDEACRLALLRLFQTDVVEARALELTFDAAVLQAQLKSLQEGLRPLGKDRVRARYVGAGLVLTGRVTPEEHRRVLWEVLRRSLGRFALDDQLEVAAPPARDAGP